MIYFENHEIINALTHSSSVLISTKTVSLSKTKVQILVEDDLTLGFTKVAELWLPVDWLTVQEAWPRAGKRNGTSWRRGSFCLSAGHYRGTGTACPQSGVCSWVFARYCSHTHERWNGSISSEQELTAVVYFWWASLKDETIQNFVTW